MTQSTIDALEKESREMNNLKSKVILPSIVMFKYKDAFYIVKELIDLGSLRNCLQNCREFFTEENIRVLLYKILIGLKALHNEGKVHRNLNPDNILLDSSGKVKFSNVAYCNEVLDEFRGLNQEKLQDLSSIFIAPEVFENSSRCNKSADIWSIGIIAIEMVYGDFERLSKEIVLEVDGLINFRKFLDDENKFEKIYGWIPKNLLSFIKKCLVPSSENRISVTECLELPLFKNVKYDGYFTFLKENQEIKKIRSNVLDLRIEKSSNSNDSLPTNQGRFLNVSEAEKIIDEKYTLPSKIVNNKDKSTVKGGESIVFTSEVYDSCMTRTKTGRFILAEINASDSCNNAKTKNGLAEMSQKPLISRKYTCNFSLEKSINYFDLKDTRTKKHFEYKKGRFRIFEGETNHVVPSREAIVSEMDYLSRLKSLYSRQMNLLQGILECNSITDKGIEYQLYREFHELRILLDQLRLSGSPTLLEHKIYKS